MSDLDKLLRKLSEYMESVERLRAENAELKEKINALFDNIKHGDNDHQTWLKNAISEHFEPKKQSNAWKGVSIDPPKCSICGQVIVNHPRMGIWHKCPQKD